MTEKLASLWSGAERLNERAITLPDCGTTEAESAIAFDDLLGDVYFKIYREVVGKITQPKFYGEQDNFRIDRILVPNKAALDAGWTGGIIGVELKRSDIKAGRAICQSMDYMRSVFRLPGSGFSVSLEACFVWPLAKPACDIACIMAQHRIGVTCKDYRGLGLQFFLGDQRSFAVSRNYIQIGDMDFYWTVGRKQGSR